MRTQSGVVNFRPEGVVGRQFRGELEKALLRNFIVK